MIRSQTINGTNLLSCPTETKDNKYKKSQCVKKDGIFLRVVTARVPVLNYRSINTLRTLFPSLSNPIRIT